MEAIAQAQVEDRQTAQQRISTPAGLVPSAVIGRALTSAGNRQHSIERIVAFFQKNPTGSATASFMQKEFGEGGKGVTIGRQEYALWFSNEGFRIAPGRTAFGPGSTLITWVNAAAMVSNLLRDGAYAAQEKIDGARDNEYRELAEKLWYLRQDFSDNARKRNLLPIVSQHFMGKGFPDDTKEIAELLKNPASRQQIVQEMSEFVGAYERDPDLLRFRKIHNPPELFANIVGLFTPPEQFKSVESFAPVKASFITEDEIDRLLMRGGNYEDSKFSIYSYFMQGHNAKECAQFLRDVYGDGGYSFTGHDEWHDSKGIKFTRGDEETGFKGYDTVRLNWNQVQKRIRELIDSGRYLNQSERDELPHYEKFQLARQINSFFYHDPSSLNRDGSHAWVYELAEKKYLPMLDHPDQVDDLYRLMLSDFASLSPDAPHYNVMQEALRNVAAYQRGEYSLFTPLPEAVLQAERQAKQAAKEAKKAEQAQHTPPPPKEPEGKLAAAARALSKKMQPQAVEDDDGQISFDLFSTLAPEPQEPEPPMPEMYERYAPMVKNLVLADEAYQNACINSDRENAYLEGGEAVLRAALTIGADDTVFLRLSISPRVCRPAQRSRTGRSERRLSPVLTYAEH